MAIAHRFLLLLALVPAIGCVSAGAGPAPAAVPEFLLGHFADDYGVRYTISRAEWAQLPDARYHIVRWDLAGQFAVARNDADNAAEGGLWTRIDWVQLPGMAPYSWAYCYSAYDAPSAEAAEAVSVAHRATPRTGCNGFPFSRMRRLPADSV